MTNFNMDSVRGGAAGEYIKGNEIRKGGNLIMSSARIGKTRLVKEKVK